MSEMSPASSLPVADAAEVMARLGRRVRALREAAGLPRRVVSERSGVSPRYLAQLELGEGNMSIALLARVAGALNMPTDALLRDGGGTDPRLAQLTSLFLRADASTQAAVLDQLAQTALAAPRAHRICLVGLRGAGKSTLGQRAGVALDVPFVELNQEIARKAGMPVAEIMALYGPEGYRTLEADALRDVVGAHDRMVLAVGGGLVAAPETYAFLLERCHTIWLRARPEDHMARVRAQGDERPMAGHPEAMAQLRAILSARDTLYAQAHVQLDTADASEEQSLAQLLDLIQSHGFLA